MNADLIGKTISGYQVTQFIGKGGMGLVYKVRHLELEQDRALKVMDPGLVENEAFMRRFKIEAKALAKLKSPYIVSVYDLSETPIGVCLIMEYVKGSTLADIIRSVGALPTERVFKLFKQILRAFEHAHGAGVLHRDIKPGNVMVTESDEVKVTDFGLARIQQKSSVTTATQMVGGTLYYMSPEQIEGLTSVDHRSDLYSIGMTMYEALTGAVPFDKTESEFKVSERIVKGNVPPPRTLNANVPKLLNSFVVQAIAHDVNKRFQSAAEMRRDLERIEIELRSAQQAPPPRLSAKKIIPIGAVLLVIVALVVWRLASNKETGTPAPGGTKQEVPAPGRETTVVNTIPEPAVAPVEPKGLLPEEVSATGREAPKPKAAEGSRASVAAVPASEMIRLQVFVHDRKRNPLAGVVVRLYGKEGRVLSVTTDASGRGAVQYDLQKSGGNPLVDIAVVHQDGKRDTSQVKRRLTLIAGKKAVYEADIDVNEWIPTWDDLLDGHMIVAEREISKKNYENARYHLQQVTLRRPGQGSEEAYVLLGQAWFEDDDDYYREALGALQRAYALRRHILGSRKPAVLESMYYYLIRVRKKEYDELDRDDAKRPKLQEEIKGYWAPFSESLKDAGQSQPNEKRYKEHLSEVEEILRDLE